MVKNKIEPLIHAIKKKSRWIIDLSIRGKIIKALEG